MASGRNLLLWLGVALIVAGLWYFVARVRLHLIDPLAFIAWIAGAAAALTALFWWGLAGGSDDDTNSGSS
ncbi:MAG: hypothetical protein IRZ04_08480 [Rhodospirillales bacterium]|nr:hypothetical protein [Rhodospirillales bacterium]